MENAQLVLGANGCLGRALTASLHDGGYWTRVMVRDAMRFREISSYNDLDLRKGDAGIPDHLERALQEVQTVFFCAAPSIDNPHYANVYRHIFRNLLECAAGTDLHIVLPSCFEIYGPPIGGAMSEDHPLEPLTLRGKALRKLEADAALWRKENNLNITVLRFGHLVGPGLSSGAVPDVINQVISGENITLINRGKAENEWMASSAAARAMILCLENEKLANKIWNVPGIKMKWLDLYSLIIEITGVKVKTRSLPLWLARMAAGGNERLMSLLYQYRFDTCLNSSRFIETTGFNHENDISGSLRQMIGTSVNADSL